VPVLFVKKKGLCINFHGLNCITKKDQYLLPLISDLFDSLCKAYIYTKIDFYHIYHLVQIAKDNKWKIAFQMYYGFFKWSVMPFRLTNTSAAFQHFINDIQYWNHIKKVFKQLCKFGLYAKVEKYEFYSDSIEYLDYVLSSSGLTMSNAKVKTIQDWFKPKKVKNIQSFLGFTNFYKCFIYNYSNIVILLTYLTRKDIFWNFDNNCRKSFNSLKQVFITASVME